MRKFLIRTIDRVTNHPWINLSFGLLLLVSGLHETFTDIDQGFALKAHHGVVLMGIAHSFRSLSMILKGLKMK